MHLGNGPDRYGPVAKTVHWLTFLLLLASFGIGLSMTGLPLSPRKLQVYSWHKWVGVTVFLLTLVRLAWRLADPPPPLPDSLPRWHRTAARLSHAALYLVLFVMPVTGWTMSSALGLQTVYLGLVPLPDLVAPDRPLGETLRTAHGVLAVVLAALFAVHAGAGLQHHFVARNDVLRRMVPFLAPRGRPPP